ncbi:MAG: hypothetical protein ISQ22_07845 [Rhizobiales bacterium]|nr:hypothetical protein [Hyphomicrobiales bacterium]
MKKNLKPVPTEKKKSLGKLPKKVRNKMGYMKDGGGVARGMGAATQGGKFKGVF